MIEAQDVTAVPIDLLRRELGVGERHGAFRTFQRLFGRIDDPDLPDDVRADFLDVYWRLCRAEEILCDATEWTE